MTRLPRPVLLLLVLTGARLPPVHAQTEPAHVRCYDTDDGLPHPSVTTLLEDHRGFLWVGTERGLARFDGRTFERFIPPGETLGEVSALLETADGTIWVGTNQRGVFRLDGRTGALRRASPQISSVVQSMEEGPGGRLLLRFDPGFSPSRGWVYLDGRGRLRPFRPHPRVPVADVMRTPDRRLWLVLASNAVYRLDPDGSRWQPVAYDRDPGPPSDSSAFYLENGHLRLWRAGGRVWGPAPSMTRLGPVRTHEPYLYNYGTPTRSGSALVWNDTWWSAFTTRLTAWHPTRGVQTFGPDPTDPSALPDARVLSVAAGRSGMLWVGTTSRGVCGFDRTNASLQKTPLSAVAAHATRVGTAHASTRGELFLGLDGALAVQPSARAPFQAVQPALPFPGGPFLVKAVYRDRRGTLWAAQWGGGLWRLDTARHRWRRYVRGDASGFAAVAARVFFEDRQGRFWVGTEEGLQRYLPESDTFVRPAVAGAGAASPPTTTSVPVWALLEQADGALWVGTYEHGLCRLDPRTGQERCHPVGGAAGHGGSVSALLPGPGGSLWVGTYGGGLCRFDPRTGQEQCLTEAEGLLSDVVYALLQDRRGRLWMSTQHGLSCYDPASGTFQNFRLPTRAPQVVLTNGVGARLPGGHFVFGGVGGYVRFHPDSLGASTIRPPVRLTSVRFFDRDVPPGAPERAGGGVRVPPTERYVSFAFAALDLRAPERLRYRYRLTGFDPGWSEATSVPTATYTSLPPGPYTFEVRATNAAGLWNALPLRVPVVVVPPFWARTWVRVMAGLLLALGFGGAVQALSTRKLRGRLRALEAERRLQAERDRISRDLHDHVGAQMATVVSAAELVRLSARAGDDAGAQRYADVVATDARAAMRELRRAVTSLRAEALSPRELGARLERDARARLQLPGAPALHVVVAGDPAQADVPLAPVQTHQLYCIAQEAITNAVRHAAAARIEVRLRLTPQGLRLTVQDDGRGFAGPFPPGDGVPDGNGLRNMHTRAREIGGTVTVRTAPGAGTTVEATVPLTGTARP